MFVDVVMDQLAEIILEIVLSNRAVLESDPVGALVGYLSVFGGNGSETFTLTNDPSNMFSISGNQLLVNGFLDFATSPLHYIAVSATGGLTQQFTINVSKTARPLDISLTGFVDGSGEFFIEGETPAYHLSQSGLTERNNLLDSYVERVRRIPLRGFSSTGTIAAASNLLTVADASGFRVGDKIIIQTGGEAGLGLRGTEGVGGAWPALSYPDEATMRADTTQPPYTWCWLRDSGLTWQWNWFGPVDWFPTNDLFGRYYHYKVCPKALVTTITNIAGSVLTLAAPAVVASTGASVFIDNKPIIDAAIAIGGTRIILDMPAGTFAFSDHLRFIGTYAGGQHGWTLRGAGREATTLLVPDGVQFSQDFQPALTFHNQTELWVCLCFFVAV
jgi:hypothetical protein